MKPLTQALYQFLALYPVHTAAELTAWMGARGWDIANAKAAYFALPRPPRYLLNSAVCFMMCCDVVVVVHSAPALCAPIRAI